MLSARSPRWQSTPSAVSPPTSTRQPSAAGSRRTRRAPSRSSFRTDSRRTRCRHRRPRPPASAVAETKWPTVRAVVRQPGSACGARAANGRVRRPPCAARPRRSRRVPHRAGPRVRRAGAARRAESSADAAQGTFGGLDDDLDRCGAAHAELVLAVSYPSRTRRSAGTTRASGVKVSSPRDGTASRPMPARLTTRKGTGRRMTPGLRPPTAVVPLLWPSRRRRGRQRPTRSAGPAGAAAPAAAARW